METLLLKFCIRLEVDFKQWGPRAHGPYFHRWLPNGKEDALVLNTGDPSAKLVVWFERLGFKRDEEIIFDYKRREVDAEAMRKQGVIEAGPLWGSLEVTKISQEELAALKGNKSGDSNYIALGKRILQLICPPVSRFLNVIRVNYGQYWVKELEKWDSRKESLGRYCGSKINLGLEWSLDGGEIWTKFEPDQPSATLTVVMSLDRDFTDYLSLQDWQEIEQAVNEGYEPSLAALLATRAHQLADQGNLKHALIEGVSALEVGVEDFMRQALKDDDYLQKSAQAFWNLPLSSQMIAVLATLGTIPLEDLVLAVKAVEMRNKIVHDGWDPPDTAKGEMTALLRSIAALLPGPSFRFPTINPGNKIMPAEEWCKISEGKEKA